ncbi:MAG: phenylacetate--CoA ligase family protein [Parvibaculaceae bacterium]
MAWPPIALDENAVLTALLAQLDATQWLTPAELEENQARQLAVVSEHHKAHTPAFAARLKTARVSYVDTMERLRHIEPLSRGAVQALGEQFFARQVPRHHLPLGAAKTSGSTGEPVAVRKTAVNRLFWSAFTLRDHLWNERSFSLRMSSIRANISRYVDARDWGAPVGNLFRTGQAQGIPITTDIREQLRLLRRFRPELLIVYPNNLDAFVSIWEKEGFGLAGLRHLKTIGETVSADLRRRARQTTGLEIEDNYSSQEAGTIAIQCRASGLYHVMSEALIVEVLDERWAPCREGEIGRVVVSDLHNLATPLIRYDIGDYAEVGPPCPCGRGLPTLKRILGRERNLVRLPDGSRNWPLVGFHHYDTVAPIRQYQLIQHTIDEIELRLVADEDLSREQEEQLIEIVRRSLGHPFRITITQSRERLPVGPNGKLEEFICRLP